MEKKRKDRKRKIGRRKRRKFEMFVLPLSEAVEVTKTVNRFYKASGGTGKNC
jgi:hypothetical protein